MRASKELALADYDIQGKASRRGGRVEGLGPQSDRDAWQQAAGLAQQAGQPRRCRWLVGNGVDSWASWKQRMTFGYWFSCIEAEERLRGC